MIWIKKGDLVTSDGREGVVVREFEYNSMGYGRVEVLFFDKNEFQVIYNTYLARANSEKPLNRAASTNKPLCASGHEAKCLCEWLASPVTKSVSKSTGIDLCVLGLKVNKDCPVHGHYMRS